MLPVGVYRQVTTFRVIIIGVFIVTLYGPYVRFYVKTKNDRFEMSARMSDIYVAVLQLYFFKSRIL